jgi:type I restriction enzyme S subunit
MPFVKPPELCDGALDSAEDGLSEAGAKIARKVPPNSILVSCIGNLGKIGMAGLKRAMVSTEDLPCLLVQRTARIRGRSALDSRFVMYLIGCAEFTRHILGVQTGIGVPHISGQQIKDFVFHRPDVTTQRQIAGQLDELSAETERLASIYEQKLAALDELKKSLLHQAFSGEL